MERPCIMIKHYIRILLLRHVFFFFFFFLFSSCFQTAMMTGYFFTRTSTARIAMLSCHLAMMPAKNSTINVWSARSTVSEGGLPSTNAMKGSRRINSTKIIGNFWLKNPHTTELSENIYLCHEVCQENEFNRNIRKHLAQKTSTSRHYKELLFSTHEFELLNLLRTRAHITSVKIKYKLNS